MATSLADKERAVETIADIQRLLWLDDLWTDSLQGVTVVSAQDVASLQKVTGKMEDLLSQVAQDSQWVAEIIQQQPDVYEEALTRAVNSGRLNAKKKREILKKFKRRGGFTKYILESANALNQNYETTIEELRTEVQKLNLGQSSEGDLPKWAKCALIGVGIGAAIETANVPAAVALVVKAEEIGCFD